MNGTTSMHTAPLQRVFFAMANPRTTAAHSGPLAIPPAGILAVAGYCRRLFPEVRFRLRDFGAEQLSLEEQVDIVRQWDPQIVGMGARSFIYPASVRLAQAIKLAMPHVRIVLGGQHVTLMPEDTEYPEAIDCVLRGEGEHGFTELLRRYAGGEPWPKVFNAEYLDALDHPMAWDLIEKPGAYRASMSPFNTDAMGSVVWSRGCPFNCFFCSGPALWKGSTPRVRYRSAQSICDELEYLVDTLGLKRIFVHDDTLNANPHKCMEICDEIIRRGIKIEWAAAGMRANRSLTPPELFAKAYQAGCRMISFGIETGDAQVLEKLNRRVSHEESERALRLTKEHGMKTGAGFTIGHIWLEPDGSVGGETVEQIERTIAYIRRLVSRKLLWSVTVSVVDPVPGSQLWNVAKDRDLLLLEDFEDLLAFDRVQLNYRHPNLTAEQIDDLYLRAYRAAMFDPQHLAYVLQEIKSMRDLKGVLRVGWFMVMARLFSPLKRLYMKKHMAPTGH